MALFAKQHIPPPLHGDPLRSEGGGFVLTHSSGSGGHHTLRVASTGDTREARRAGAKTAP